MFLCVLLGVWCSFMCCGVVGVCKLCVNGVRSF